MYTGRDSGLGIAPLVVAAAAKAAYTWLTAGRSSTAEEYADGELTTVVERIGERDATLDWRAVLGAWARGAVPVVAWNGRTNADQFTPQEYEWITVRSTLDNVPASQQWAAAVLAVLQAQDFPAMSRTTSQALVRQILYETGPPLSASIAQDGVMLAGVDPKWLLAGAVGLVLFSLFRR